VKVPYNAEGDRLILRATFDSGPLAGHLTVSKELALD